MKIKTSELSGPPLPWSAYEVRYSEKHPIHHIQIRDALGNILFVSARYGEHTGAPIGDKAMRVAAKRLLDAVNGVQT